jgi:uroporphyrin-III C-methyltransferase
MTGHVALVSAGPGDPDLLTVKALRLIRAADAILYDDLSARAILDHARADARLIDVGKRAGRPSCKQGVICAMLVDLALGGARVVRLKSGDAAIFGRLEEELLALRAAGIAHEVVPGVSSASAAAAAARIPLTRRLTARRVQFITGHDVNGKLPESLNLGALADPEATTALFMGKRTFPELARRLIAAGLPPETPALLAESISQPGQRLTRSTVAALAAMLADGPGEAPGLILYGPLAEMQP